MKRRFPGTFSAVAIAAVLVTQPSFAGVRLTEVGRQFGFQPFTTAGGMGTGIAAADFDNDGDVDVFLPTGPGTPDRLYRSIGGGTFEEIAADVGLASTESHRAALWFDYDGDGDLDLVVAGDCFDPTTALPQLCPDPTTILFYRQNIDGTFSDVTAEAGLDVPLVPENKTHLGGMCAGDINNDGYPDLFITLWGRAPWLFLNSPTGVFTNIGVSSLIATGPEEQWQPMMYDFNGDGWQDIFATVDFNENHLWINQGNNTFLDMAASAGVDNAMNDMGIDLDDYDNDGDIDVYITNVFGVDNGTGLSEHNILLRNDSVGGYLSFTEVAVSAGVDDTQWGWGATFIDGDNDGWLDLAVTNGFIAESPYAADVSKFFRNIGGDPVSFANITSESGFNDTYWGSTVITFDFDRDGDLDLLQTCIDVGLVRLLENSPTEVGNYLVVKPRMSGPNTHSLGAVVRATYGSTTLTRLITAGTSFLGQEPAEAFFGLGAVQTLDTVTVEWPDGTSRTLNNVSTNRSIVITPLAIPCGDVVRLKSKCTLGGVVWAKLILTSQEHDGESVTLSIDGATYDATIQGRSAKLQVPGQSGTGFVKIELQDPAGCLISNVVFCP